MGILWASLFISLLLESTLLTLFILSHFVSSPTSVHFIHLLHVLRYLWETSSQCLFYACDSPLQLHAYLDSTWASDAIYRRSITVYCILLGSSLSWKSKK
ncbi:hypothetical protein GUJ93_ZPchr0015g6811 [Zizania palustris]|uniref:Uncharacterized protein n=1 Tax=Zizania palustris TaxID=103762 RepID=A0A8J5TLX6_ZIZPA|nr:hypothetical protein GUJ93_ZPchr0015g6811 [Zizania palustris]